jgi:Spy/CpxP family protein refolding chaperone
MKPILSTLLFVFTLLVSLTAESQNPERFPMLRERMVQAKLREIKLSLKLDQSTFDQFRPIYLKYEREVSGVNFRNLARLTKVDADSLSTEEADQLIVNQFESAKKMISIREKYYKEFRTVITPQQIIKLYQTEAELRKKVMQEMKRRMMNR